MNSNQNEGLLDKLELQNWTPLHTRIVAHRIGDGTVNFYGRPVYDNKNIKDFLALMNKLDIKFWKPTRCKKWGTYKLVLPKTLFDKFAEIFDADSTKLIHDPLYLLDCISKLPKEHKLQAILAFIVDDGSCVNWRITIFEDQNKDVVHKVAEIWNSLYPNTSKTSYMVTPKGTKIYHLYSDRNGVIKLYGDILKAVEKLGPLANLWWKQNTLQERYLKATSLRGQQLNETRTSREGWKKRILEYTQEKGYVTTRIAMKLLNITYFRAYRTLLQLIRENELHLTKAGSRARYLLNKEDISFDYRKNLILAFLRKNKLIYNRDARRILNLRAGQTYKFLKKMCDGKLIKQIKNLGETKYVLFTFQLQSSYNKAIEKRMGSK